MSKERCYHCQDVVPASHFNADAEKQFCCNGCEIAFHIMGDNGADAFYQMRELSGNTNTKNGTKKALRIEEAESFGDSYASDSFKQHYVQEINSQRHAVTWYVQGMHCAACVWLLERLHIFDVGIQSSRIHFGNQQLITYYDPQQTDPAKIAHTLARIGYHLYPWHSPLRKQQQVKDQRQLFLRFAISCASMLGCMHVSWNILAGEFTLDLDTATRHLFSLMAAVLCIPAVTYCAWPWYRAAWQGLKQKRLNINLSISSIILMGTAISSWHLYLGRSDLYFDAMAMFVCFLLGGKLMLHLAQQQVGQQQETLKQLLPLFVNRVNKEQETPISIDDIQPGDELVIDAGQRIPVDATLCNQEALVDNALLSGEQYPIAHRQNDSLCAGALVLDKACRIRATSAYHNSRIAHILQDKQETDCDTQTRSVEQGDRLLQWFTPVVSLLALVTWLAWSTHDMSRAWDQAIAVFIVACPCAIGIAAPLCHAVAMRAAAQDGILINNAPKLALFQRARHFIFDKTGTLTNGQLQLHSCHWEHPHPEQVIPHLLAACTQSQHPLARCLVAHYHDQQVCTDDTRATFKQQGLDYACALGALRLQKASHCIDDGSNQTELLLNSTIIAQFSFVDHTRSALNPFLNKLRQRSALSICSGDHQKSVTFIGSQLGFTANACIGDQSPEQKQDQVHSKQKDGAVIMIGDGVNDALALQAADLGIGVRGGLEAAIQHSDVYISEDIETRLPQLYQIAQEHQRCLKRCLHISVAYNIIGISCAMLGLWGPFICAIAMPLSSISVIAIAWYWPFTQKNSDTQNETQAQQATTLSLPTI